MSHSLSDFKALPDPTARISYAAPFKCSVHGCRRGAYDKAPRVMGYRTDHNDACPLHYLECYNQNVSGLNVANHYRSASLANRYDYEIERMKKSPVSRVLRTMIGKYLGDLDYVQVNLLNSSRLTELRRKEYMNQRFLELYAKKKARPQVMVALILAFKKFGFPIDEQGAIIKHVMALADM